MKLYFLRHGLADWPNWDSAHDEERPLTDEGLAKMKAEAKAIAQLGLKVEAIVSSPYLRARQTADAVARRLDMEVVEDQALAPGFGVERLGEVLQHFPNAGAVMLVGHEPDFSRTISALIGGGRVVMKKGGLARVDVESIDPPDGELVWLVTSKTLGA
jgi:phosphohistidine phosphatase